MDAKTRADFELMNVTIPEKESETDTVVEVWAENWKVFDVFLALETQWRVAVVGGAMSAGRVIWVGLDYIAADVVLRRFGFADDDRKVLADLKVMEIAAISAHDEVSNE